MILDFLKIHPLHINQENIVYEITNIMLLLKIIMALYLYYCLQNYILKNKNPIHQAFDSLSTEHTFIQFNSFLHAYEIYVDGIVKKHSIINTQHNEDIIL